MAKKEKPTPTPTPTQSAPEDEERKEKSQDPIEKKKLPLKFIIIVALALILGIGGGVVVMTLLGGDPPPVDVVETTEVTTTEVEEPEDSPVKAPQRDNAGEPEEEEGDTVAEGEAPAGDVFVTQNIDLETFTVNLIGGKRYLKLTMSVESDTQELTTEIEQKMHVIRDKVGKYLRGQSYDSISTGDGEERMRSSILNRINAELDSGKIKNIYFSEFVVQ